MAGRMELQPPEETLVACGKSSCSSQFDHNTWIIPFWRTDGGRRGGTLLCRHQVTHDPLLSAL